MELSGEDMAFDEPEQGAVARLVIILLQRPLLHLLSLKVVPLKLTLPKTSLVSFQVLSATIVEQRQKVEPF